MNEIINKYILMIIINNADIKTLFLMNKLNKRFKKLTYKNCTLAQKYCKEYYHNKQNIKFDYNGMMKKIYDTTYRLSYST